MNNKTILITGGTGSFGKKFAENVLKKFKPKKLIIFSRDELKQFEMSNNPIFKNSKILRFFIGDVRDFDRLKIAFKDVDYVVHAAALKQVPTAEYNPIEYIKTNIIGAQNIIEETLDSGIEKTIALSTDKASSPINLYGATKLCSDKLFTSANNIKGKRDIKFSVVRYGNVFGSRGSIAPIFSKIKNNQEFPITDFKMTRFNITLKKSIEMVLWVEKNMKGGEIFVPKIPSYRVVDLAKAFNKNAKLKNIGIRPGEKIHEEMITKTDALNCVEFDNYYVILPSVELWDKSKFLADSGDSVGQLCKPNFSYNSGNNTKFLSIEEIEDLIKNL